jgi:outer membrane biosynthesis protein TonB
MTESISEHMAKRDEELINKFTDIDATLARLTSSLSKSEIREAQMKENVVKLATGQETNHRIAVQKIGYINTSLSAIADSRQVTLPPRTRVETSAQKRKPRSQKIQDEEDNEEKEKEEDRVHAHETETESQTEDMCLDHSEQQDDTRDASLTPEDNNGPAKSAGSDGA